MQYFPDENNQIHNEILTSRYLIRYHFMILERFQCYKNKTRTKSLVHCYKETTPDLNTPLSPSSANGDLSSTAASL